MSSGWKMSALAPKKVVQAALLAHDEIEEWDPELVIAGREVDEAHPLEWVLEGWYPRKPGAAQKRALMGLFEVKPPAIAVEKLPDTDWLVMSQQGSPPIEAGPFHVHTPDYPPKPGAIDLVIPASQAFGTGQHETTAGCLEMLGIIKRRGGHFRRVADIGTGTGLLALGARALWPMAELTATDIDPLCAGVVAENAALNGASIGARRGEIAMVVAGGMDDPLIAARGPYDLLIANILAGPLVELAPDFAENVVPGGHVVLAGLLAGSQERAVLRAHRRARFMPVGRLQRGKWAILWLRKRR